MSDYERRAGDTAQTIDVVLRATDDTPALGLAAGDVTAVYRRKGAGLAAMALVALADVSNAHIPFGFVEIDAGYCPGVYRLDLSDAMIARGSPDVVISLTGAFAPRTIVVALPTGDINIRSINNVTINGSGVEDDEFQP